MLSDLLKINTSHFTGLPEQYRENCPMNLISQSIMSFIIIYAHDNGGLKKRDGQSLMNYLCKLCIVIPL